VPFAWAVQLLLRTPSTIALKGLGTSYCFEDAYHLLEHGFPGHSASGRKTSRISLPRYPLGSCLQCHKSLEFEIVATLRQRLFQHLRQLSFGCHGLIIQGVDSGLCRLTIEDSMTTYSRDKAKGPVCPARAISALRTTPIIDILATRLLVEPPIYFTIQCTWNPPSQAASIGIPFPRRLGAEFGHPLIGLRRKLLARAPPAL